MSDDGPSMGEYEEMWGILHEIPEPTLTRDSLWTTARGERIPVHALKDSHLLNIIRCFRGKSPKGTQVAPRNPVRRREWLNLLANEAYSRGLTLEEVDEKDPTHE